MLLDFLQQSHVRRHDRPTDLLSARRRYGGVRDAVVRGERESLFAEGFEKFQTHEVRHAVAEETAFRVYPPVFFLSVFLRNDDVGHPDVVVDHAALGFVQYVCVFVYVCEQFFAPARPHALSFAVRDEILRHGAHRVVPAAEPLPLHVSERVAAHLVHGRRHYGKSVCEPLRVLSLLRTGMHALYQAHDEPVRREDLP